MTRAPPDLVWPPNDLKWPTVTWKHNFFTKSSFRACNMSFLRFFGMLSRLRLLELSLDPQNDLKMTSKWPKWPTMTWKHNSFTKSHLGACNMSFLRFFGMLSRLRSLELSLDPPNDLQMTSKWPKWPVMTWKYNTFMNSHLGSCNMSFPRYFGMLSRLRLLELSLDPPNDLQMTSKWPQVTYNDL